MTIESPIYIRTDPDSPDWIDDVDIATMTAALAPLAPVTIATDTAVPFGLCPDSDAAITIRAGITEPYIGRYDDRLSAAIEELAIGTVRRVYLAMPPQYAVTGSPVTDWGTLTASWIDVHGGYVLAGPDADEPSGQPAWRRLEVTDIGSTAPLPGTYLCGDGTWSVPPSITLPLSVSDGGTGADLSATGGAGCVVRQDAAGAAFTVSALTVVDLPAMHAAGAGASAGIVPSPGATSHAHYPYLLGDDAAWHAPSGRIIGVSYVATAESTSSTTAAALATAQSVTFTLDAASVVVVEICAALNSSAANQAGTIWCGVDGAPRFLTLSTATTAGYYYAISGAMTVSLAAGTHTLAALWSTSGGAMTWLSRCLRITLL